MRKLDIRQAAKIIQEGGIVAFPTETVYGLGANAFDANAVARVYAAKGRPNDNPLILHVNDATSAQRLAANLSDKATALMQAFWPGPLTLVLAKHPALSAWVGGHPDGVMQTVAVRSPSNPTARALIEYADCVIAAPSANKAGTPSPTQAKHVASDFIIGQEVDFLLDGGTADGGLESTVVDMTGDTPCILRPGAVTHEMLHRAIGDLAYATDAQSQPRSPGQKYKHYAPKAPMTLVEGSLDQIADFIIKNARHKNKVGILATAQTEALYASVSPYVLSVGDRESLSTIAHQLYACLRRFDELGVEEIYAEAIPAQGLGRAIMNRMVKAAEGRVIHG